MNDKEILYALADTMEKTRFELDGVRVLLRAALSTLASEPSLVQGFLANVQANIDLDEAITIASQMNDQSLKVRGEWLRRLLPAHVQPMLRIP